MGDSGARLLAKALQINSKLQYISYDRNNVTLQGYSDIAYALQWYVDVQYNGSVVMCNRVLILRCESCLIG